MKSALLVIAGVVSANAQAPDAPRVALEPAWWQRKLEPIVRIDNECNPTR